MRLEPVTLQGALATLVPLAREHAAPLARVGLHPQLWELQPRAMRSVADMQVYVEQALADQAAGISLPFAVLDRATQKVAGSTRYMDTAPAHRRLEIGATWYGPEFQRTGLNVEAKLLLLAHAFDTLAMQKVVLKTETLNTRSRTAILALGAVEEGTFRRHLFADSGRPRDMVYYAIMKEDWPAVRERLRQRLERKTT